MLNALQVWKTALHRRVPPSSGGKHGVLRPLFPYQISILLLLHVADKVLHGAGFFVLRTNGFALLWLRLSLSFFLHSGEKCLLAEDSLLGLVLLVLGIVTVPQGSQSPKFALYKSTSLQVSLIRQMFAFPLCWLSYSASATLLRFVVSKNGWFSLCRKDFTFAFINFELYI